MCYYDRCPGFSALMAGLLNVTFRLIGRAVLGLLIKLKGLKGNRKVRVRTREGLLNILNTYSQKLESAGNAF